MVGEVCDVHIPKKGHCLGIPAVPTPGLDCKTLCNQRVYRDYVALCSAVYHRPGPGPGTNGNLVAPFRVRVMLLYAYISLEEQSVLADGR